MLISFLQRGVEEAPELSLSPIALPLHVQLACLTYSLQWGSKIRSPLGQVRFQDCLALPTHLSSSLFVALRFETRVELAARRKVWQCNGCTCIFKAKRENMLYTTCRKGPMQLSPSALIKEREARTNERFLLLLLSDLLELGLKVSFSKTEWTWRNWRIRPTICAVIPSDF